MDCCLVETGNVKLNPKITIFEDLGVNFHDAHSYLIKRVPTRVLKFETLYEQFAYKFSSHSNQVFGCTIAVHIHKQDRSKLDRSVEKCVFVRYSPKQKGYKCFNPISKKSFVSMNSLRINFISPKTLFKRKAMRGKNTFEKC